MAFTAWLGIKPYQYNGSETYASYGTGTVAPYGGTWSTPAWRFDGTRIQVRGLYKTTAAQTSVDGPFLIFNLPDVVLKPTRRLIAPCMVNYITTSGHVDMARMDIIPRSGGMSLSWRTGGWVPSTAYFWIGMDIDLSFFLKGN